MNKKKEDAIGFEGYIAIVAVACCYIAIIGHFVYRYRKANDWEKAVNKIN